MEITLLPSYRFLSDSSEYPDIVLRLSRMIRGLGDPIIALYTRTYLAWTSLSLVLPKNTLSVVLTKSLCDYFETVSDFQKRKKLIEWKEENSETSFWSVQLPALSLYLNCMGTDLKKTEYETILAAYTNHLDPNGMILYCLLQHLPSQYIVPQRTVYLEWITTMNTVLKSSLFSKTQCCMQLFRKMALFPRNSSFSDQDLNQVQMIFQNESNLMSYLGGITTFVQWCLAAKVDAPMEWILPDLLLHIEPADLPTGALSTLLTLFLEWKEPIFTKILVHSDFASLLHLLRHDAFCLMAKKLLERYLQEYAFCSNASVIHVLFSVAKRLHDDGLDPLLTSTAELDTISILLSRFISTIDFSTSTKANFSDPLESLQANFRVYLDCRGAFSRCDSVFYTLIMATSALSMQACHSPDSKAFCQATLAYCQITIPSISDAKIQLDLYLHCAQIALYTTCLAVLDGLLSSAITLLAKWPNLKTWTIEDILPVWSKGLSLILYVPGVEHDDEVYGALYYSRGWLNALASWPRTPSTELALQLVAAAHFNALLLPLNRPLTVRALENNALLFTGHDLYQHTVRQHVQEHVDAYVTAVWQLQGEPVKMMMGLLDLLNFLWHRFQSTLFQKKDKKDDSTKSLSLMAKCSVKVGLSVTEISNVIDRKKVQVYWKATLFHIRKAQRTWKKESLEHKAIETFWTSHGNLTGFPLQD